MFTKQLLIDSALAVGLLSALAVVLIVDRLRKPPPPREYVEGEEPVEKRSLIGTNQPVVVRKKNQPRAGSIYAERVAENREEVVKKRGGSPISEKAVKDGLDWLARHQAQEGFWSNRCLGQFPTRLCTQPPCSSPGQDHAVGQTGMALLAFQGGGHFWFNDAEYSTQVKRGLDWLIAQQHQDGCLASSRSHYFMYEHAIATFALAEACATAMHSDHQPDAKHFAALEKAISFLDKAQHPYGGWRYRPGEAGDTSVSGWVVLALKTAKEAGVKIEHACVSKCIYFFEKCAMRDNGRTGYVDGNHAHTEATTGVGMLVHHFLLEQSDSPLVKSASSYLADYAERIWGGRLRSRPDYYAWYNCTLGMYLAGGPNWDKWNNVVRKQLEDLQVKNYQTCERGSWPASDQWSDKGGRIYSTALAVLTLEVYYRFAKKGQVQP
jgi:hypothetical protein